MNRAAADYLDEITATAEQWVRRCNGQPQDGVRMSRKGLRIVLASSSAVTAGSNGVISWTATGRRFTAEPISA